jgi:trimethylamine:corrinoid methyltransferase-like protein
MKHTLTINGREAELSLSIIERDSRVAVFATVGFVTDRGNGYKTVSHAVYSDFAQFYNATDRPKRLTQAFKNKMINGVDIDTVKRHVEAHYHNAAE